MEKMLISAIRITTFAGLTILAATLFLLPGTFTKLVHAGPGCGDRCDPQTLPCEGGCTCTGVTSGYLCQGSDG